MKKTLVLGSRTHKMTPEEEEQLLKDWDEDDAAEEAELRAMAKQDQGYLTHSK